MKNEILSSDKMIENSLTIANIRQLQAMGKPQTDGDICDRITDYFNYCEASGIKPGIESLCTALHVSKNTLVNWSAGVGCSEYRQELICDARNVIAAYLEQALMNGRISPPSAIFLAKNWLGYKDTVSIDEKSEQKKTDDILTKEDIQKILKDGLSSKKNRGK